MLNKKQPWYKNYNEWKTAAEQYMKVAVFSSSLSPEQQSEVISYWNHSVNRLIFESNLIEAAGTKTFGETARILEQIKKKYNFDFGQIEFAQNLDDLTIFSIKDAEIHIAKHEKSYKELSEVSSHLKAYVESAQIHLNFLRTYIETKKVLLLSQERIKTLHKKLANDLVDLAGEYRNFDDIIIVGLDLTFPNHKLLDKAVEEFCNRANRLIEKGLTDSNADKFMIAAQITYEFVRIHPFTDFNGRVSRILLSMIMQVFGLDFSVVLRGNKKAKDRYMWALKYANAIKDSENFDTKYLEPYATLIAMSVCEGFEQINANLRLAGLPTIASGGESK